MPDAVRAPRAHVPLLPGGILALAATALLVRSQVRAAYRRYAATDPVTRPVNLLVEPSRAPRGGGRRPLALAALGDSGMAGIGVSTVADSLPVQVAQRVADGLGRPVHVVGYGRPGATTADVLAQQVPRLAASTQACVVMVGTNDVMRLTGRRRLARDWAELLDALAAAGGPVVLSGLPEFRAMTAVPPLLRPAVAARAAMVRRMQRRAVRGRPGTVLVDVRGAVGRLFLRDRTTMSADAFHPSARGYALIADVLARAVVAALDPRRR